jgi:uncharacterized protein YecE (DUF72 family)
MNVYVGISGWTYAGWRGTFYPNDLPHHRELDFAGQLFPSIEVNGTFYSLQRPSSYQKWYDKTPDHFVFSIKANRYITHIKKLNEVEIPIANFFASGIFNLKEKLGPILWQFPPSLSFDPDKFKRFLDLLPPDGNSAKKLAKKNELADDRVALTIEANQKFKHAVEIRHQSFLNPWFIDLLREYNVALVFADTAGKWPYMEDITSEFLYLRLHGDSELYVSGYDDATLDFWARRIKSWSTGRDPTDKLAMTDDKMRTPKEIYVYFDNDAKVRAPVDAQNLMHKLPMAPNLLLH